MPSAIWTGHIAFGLVSIAVRVVAATESRSVTFRQIHQRDLARIRHERICTAEGRPVPWEEVGRGYETPDGRIVAITEDDLASLPLPTARTIEVLEFVPLESIDPIHYQRTYYLDPALPTSVRPYVLLRDTLAKAGRVGVTKVALRQRERLAVLRVAGDAIAMTSMLWPDEIRKPELSLLSEVGQVHAAPHEQEMAQMLVDTLSADAFDPSAYRDEYREKLQERIDAKLAGRPVAVPSPRGGETAFRDLAEALQASVASAKTRRGRGD